jgi:hypothetical protein
MSDDTATTAGHDDEGFDPRQDVVMDLDDEHASPDAYPRMWNMSAGMAFFQAVIRPDVVQRPEFVAISMPTRGSNPDTYGARTFAVARWNSLWEAAQFRRRFFYDETNTDEAHDLERLPTDLARIADLGDNNIVFIPRTETRYYDYAPLFHLLPRGTPERFGLPMLHGGQWPFWAELTDPDPYPCRSTPNSV